MIVIDGAMGEGGGQVLRTALALSLVTQHALRITNIRAHRDRPGLQRQHLAAVNAAQAVGQAKVDGAQVGSLALTFIPRTIEPGDYRFDIGTAGSTSLVLQTVLPALWQAASPSRLILEGGTHNPLAPPFEFIQKAYLLLVNRMGPRVVATLERPGFYPHGGGRIDVEITPAPLKPISIRTRGIVRARRALALIAGLPQHIAERELAVVKKQLGWPDADLHVEVAPSDCGPGNVLTLEIESQHVTEVFTGFGERHVRAETVALRPVQAARAYLDSDVPVGEHLADQLLLPFALARGGAYVTTTPSMHASTNIAVIQRFLDVVINVQSLSARAWCIGIES
jgi:RNA 3'-terminal phosphate cyclase (ATP)